MRRTSSALIVIVVALLSLGIVMLASTSSVKGTASYGDPQYFLKRQLLWMFVAVVVGLAMANFDYHWWQRMAPPLVLLAVIGLALVFIPRIGIKAGGSRRWIGVGPFSIQPSEFAKLATVAGVATWMTAVGRRASCFKEGLLFPLAGVAVVCGLMMFEPDFGTTFLTGTVAMLIMYAGGARLPYLVIAGVTGICGFAFAVMRDPVRLGRILAFVMPLRYPDKAYHLAQSKVAFIKGGLLGVGLGNSVQKQFYLPEAHTDFILAIIGEELGFIATLCVVLLFSGLLVCGVIISYRAPDRFGRLLGFGFTMMIALQAAINVGVVTGCLPTKGLPLPFISYGGSSLVASVAGVCVLLNIAGHGVQGGEDGHTGPIKDRAHRL